MKKLLITLMLPFFSMPIAAMQTNPKYSVLHRFIETYETEKNAPEVFLMQEKFYKKFEQNIAKLEPLTQDEMFEALVYSLEPACDPAITKTLLSFWHKTFDINYRDITKTKNMRSLPLFNIVVKQRTRENSPSTHYELTLDTLRVIKDLKQLYIYICETFKDTLNINIKDDNLETPFIFACGHFVRFQKFYTMEAFFEEFLQQFHTKIDIETTDRNNQTAFDMCHNTKTLFIGFDFRNDDKEVTASKKSLLVLLKKYFPDKLCLTKEKLNNLNNTRFFHN